jgi:hypothetical protein
MRLFPVFLACLCVLAGCAPPLVTPAAPPPAIVSQTESVVAAPATAEVWGEVPTQCACHTDPLVLITSDLRDLPVKFQLENAVDGWHVFSVKFDPAAVPPDRIRAILKDAGALIIPAPVVGAP